MLAKMTYDGLKGLDGSMEFDRLNLIVGLNGSGKSALLLGVAYGATGKTPMSDRSAAILGYSPNGKCRVHLELDDGYSWTRGCERNEYTQTVVSSLILDGKPRLGLRAAEGELAKRVGDFAPMFNIGSFLSMRPEQRREFILDLLSGPESRAAQEITNRLEIAKVALSDTTAAHKGLVASVREMTGRKQAAGTETREELTSDIEAAESNLADVNRRIGKVSGLKTARRKLNQSIESEERDRSSLAVEADARKIKAQEVKEWRSVLLAKQAIADEPMPPAVESKSDVLRADKREAVNSRNELSRLQQRISDDYRSCEVNEAREATKLLICADWAQVREIVEAMDESDGQKKILAIAEAKLSDFGYAVLAEKVDGLRTGLKSLTSQASSGQRELDSTIADIAKMDERIEASVKESSDAENVRAVKIQEIIAAKLSVSQLASDISVYEQRCVGCDKAIETADEKIVGYEKQLNELDVDSGESHQTLVDQKDGLGAHLNKVKELLVARKEADDALANLSEVTEKMHKTATEVESAKATVEKTRKERDESLGKLMSPILNGIGEFCGETTYCDLVNERGTPIFEIGVLRHGVRISMDALSGGERAMYCVGLIVAMTNLTDQREKFLLVEAAELDAINLAKLAERISTKAADFQVFLATITAPLGLPGWRVHNLSSGAV